MNSTNYSYISLDDWQLVRVSGPDNQNYLQGQVTADITLLTDNHATFAAHCDAQGKMWSNMLMFKRGADIFYILRKNVVDRQIAELKKYAVFSKVSIEKVDDLNMVGLIGEIHPAIVSLLGEHNCATHLDTTYIALPLPEKRMIMVSPEPLPENLLPSKEWFKLDILAGYPIIDAENMARLLPQACNLQILDGISFEKGCYSGQEMVARAQFRGANKNGLYLLSGTSEHLPIMGDKLEQKIGENWRETGQILAAFRDEAAGANENIYIQAILSNGIDVETRFRIKNQPESQLEFH